MRAFICDEVNDSYTMDVLPSGAAEVTNNWTYKLLASGTATGAISVSADIILHKIFVGTTATKGMLYIGTNAASTNDCYGSHESSASGVTEVDLSTRAVYDLDIYVPKVSKYRLSGIDCRGVTLVYETL